MSEDEVLLFVEASVENGSDIPESVADMHFIDDCLTMQRMVRTFGKTKTTMYTKNGNLRKGLGFQDFINKRLDSLIIETKKP